MAITASYGNRTDTVLDGVIKDQADHRRHLMDTMPAPETDRDVVLQMLVMQVCRVADALEQLAVVTAGPVAHDAIRVERVP